MPTSPRTGSIARIISIVGHPIAVVPTSITVAMQGRVEKTQAAVVLAAACGAVLLVAAFVVHGVRTGRLSHIDVSRREERGSFYLVSLLAVGGATGVLHWTGSPRGAVVGMICAFGLLLVASIVNRWIKASLHTAFVVVAAGIVGLDSPAFCAGFLVLACAVAWSRLALGRHDALEVGVGAALGVLTSAALAWARASS